MTDNLSPKPERQHPLYNMRPPTPRPAPDPNAPQRPRRHVKLARPTATYILIAVNVLVFVVRALSVDLNWSLLDWGANSPQLVLQAGEYYRLFTSMFLHASIYAPSGGWALANSAHLAFNMYILYVVGRGLEPVFRAPRFTAIYLLGGLTGSLLSALLGDWQSYSVGASGAVFAVLGAEFIFLYQHKEMMGAAGAAQRRSLINLGVINLIFGLLANSAGSAMRIDNWAHIGGLAGGVILAWFLGPKVTLRPDPLDPNTLVVDDANPFSGRLGVIFAYTAGLVILLLLGMGRTGG
ncbi:MAG: rhomboid family intramembrane serine protease [Anaerolineaceae bacterium]|nr:rhomboid family intramembrane serine protease [Anaerolineaceae bacterium]